MDVITFMNAIIYLHQTVPVYFKKQKKVYIYMYDIRSRARALRSEEREGAK